MKPIDTFQNRLEKALKIKQAEERKQQKIERAKSLEEFWNNMKIGKTYVGTISKIADYIRLNYSQELTATVLGNYANMTYANLSRLFKKEMGITIGKYISSMRCMEAGLLLRKSHYSIQEISAYVGYLDNNYFVKVFKKETGYLPSEYRKTNKE